MEIFIFILMILFFISIPLFLSMIFEVKASDDKSKDECDTSAAEHIIRTRRK